MIGIIAIGLYVFIFLIVVVILQFIWPNKSKQVIVDFLPEVLQVHAGALLTIADVMSDSPKIFVCTCNLPQKLDSLKM